MAGARLLGVGSSLTHLLKAIDSEIPLHGDLFELLLHDGKIGQLFVGFVRKSDLLLVEAVVILPEDGDLLEELLILEGQVVGVIAQIGYFLDISESISRLITVLRLESM